MECKHEGGGQAVFEELVDLCVSWCTCDQNKCGLGDKLLDVGSQCAHRDGEGVWNFTGEACGDCEFAVCWRRGCTACCVRECERSICPQPGLKAQRKARLYGQRRRNASCERNRSVEAYVLCRDCDVAIGFDEVVVCVRNGVDDVKGVGTATDKM